MRYHSTRSATEFVSGPEAILQGLAPDGGLYVPENLPKLDIPQLLTRSPMDMASDILAAFLPELPDMPGLVRSAYTGKLCCPGCWWPPRPPWAAAKIPSS